VSVWIFYTTEVCEYQPLIEAMNSDFSANSLLCYVTDRGLNCVVTIIRITLQVGRSQDTMKFQVPI
jgi:hypothetical protein